MAKHDDSKGNSFARSILRGVQLPTVIEIAKDSAEAGVDAMLEDSFAAIIPGVKILEYLVRLPSNVSNELFKRSVMGFIEAGEEAKPEEWQKFIEKLEEQKGGLDRAGDILMRSLANLDDQRKATYLGMIYAAAARRELTISELKRCCMIIDRVYLDDLDEFAMVVYSAGDGLVEARVFLGLVDRLTNSKIRGGIGPEQDEPTSIALKLLHVVSEEGRLR